MAATQLAGDQRPRPGGRSARCRARELALQGIYEWLVGGQELAAVEGHLMESEGFDRADREHLREILHGVIDAASALREQFTAFIDRRPELLSPVEHGIPADRHLRTAAAARAGTSL